MATLVTTRYVPPGSYIGQLIAPTPSEAPEDVRIPCYIGRGSRLARGSNLPIRRSFISEESLTFSTLEPYIAPLQHAADGDQSTARLFKEDGTEIRRDQWSFQNVEGEAREILLSPEVFESDASYVIDYQSIDRDILDPLPVTDIRSLDAVGTSPDNPEFKEFEHVFLVTALSNPSTDDDNENPSGSVEDPEGDSGNSGNGTVTLASSSQYNHNYTRWYEVEIDSTTEGVNASGSVTFDSGSNHVDGDTFTLDDGFNDPVTFELDSDGTTEEGNISITFASGDSADDIASAAETAINGLGSSTLLISGSASTATVSLENDRFAEAGNTSIESDVDSGASSFSTTDFSGGVDRQVTIAWSSDPISPGNEAQAPVPLDGSVSNPGTTTNPTITVADSFGTGDPEQELENGIVLEFGFGSGSDEFEQGDRWTFNGLGPGLIETNARYENTNQFPVIEDPEEDDDNSGTGSMEVTEGSQYEGEFNSTFTFEVTSVNGTASASDRTATLVWAEHGDRIGVSGSVSLDETSESTLSSVEIQNGVSLDFDFGSSNFAEGDRFVVAAKAPRKLYRAKDNRQYTFTVSVAENQEDGQGFVSGSYVTDTVEGGFGTWEAEVNDENPNSSDWESGHFELPDRVILAVRNTFKAPTSSQHGNQHSQSDVHEMSGTSEDLLDWSFRQRENETIENDDILTDVSGAITGSPNTKYVILNNEPEEVESVVNEDDEPLSFTWIEDTPYIYFGSDPDTTIDVQYLHRSEEPDPGQIYYVTGNYLRPDDLYNTPILVNNRQEGRDLLAPAGRDNHLHIMNEIAFDNDAPAVMYIQVNDADGDGNYTDLDFKSAIDASEAPQRITDVTVLSNFNSLSPALASVTKMNDPFERRERILWVGAPIGTPIGDSRTADSLVYLSKNTLQTFGNSPAHGTRILVGSTEARRQIRLENGSEIEVVLDGSFVAGALASVAASFDDPGQTILRSNVEGFTDIETYGDVESPENIRLGGSQIIYLTNRGGGTFRIEEDVTVSTVAEDFRLINNMTQKQFVTRYVRKETDDNLISVVVPSPEAGSALVKGFVTSALSTLVTQGLIGQYQDENGNTRPIDPDVDVVVFQDSDDSTLYHFFYSYYLRNSIKRLFGLFTVNTNDFGLSRG